MREGVTDTPRRVADMYEEIFAGIGADAAGVDLGHVRVAWAVQVRRPDARRGVQPDQEQRLAARPRRLGDEPPGVHPEHGAGAAVDLDADGHVLAGVARGERDRSLEVLTC